jgi:hypothetical protein
MEVTFLVSHQFNHFDGAGCGCEEAPPEAGAHPAEAAALKTVFGWRVIATHNLDEIDKFVKLVSRAKFNQSLSVQGILNNIWQT